MWGAVAPPPLSFLDQSGRITFELHAPMSAPPLDCSRSLSALGPARGGIQGAFTFPLTNGIAALSGVAGKAVVLD